MSSTSGLSGLSSDYEKVRDFTIQAGYACAEEPSAMNKDEVRFLLRMCLSELQELALTVTNSVPESVELLQDCMKTIDKSAHEKLHTEDEIIAAQADAIVDAWYYGCNAFAKKSVDVSQIFNTVHQANMDKRDPKTKKFIKREDGKIIKPKGWSPPDIVVEVKQQRKILKHISQEKQYHSAIETAVSKDRANEIVLRMSKSSISTFIKNDIELPTMDVKIEEKTNNCTVTFEWKDRLRYFLYPYGNSAVLDMENLKLLEGGFNSSGAIDTIVRWLENYSQRKPPKLTLDKVSVMNKDIKLEDMK